jgi:uncharacterized protein (TIGR03000 family)
MRARRIGSLLCVVALAAWVGPAATAVLAQAPASGQVQAAASEVPSPTAAPFEPPATPGAASLPSPAVPPATPATGAAGPPGPSIHYHTHYHFAPAPYASPPPRVYPSYDTPYLPGSPAASFPLPYQQQPPTPAQPYPSYWEPGSFVPPPFPGNYQQPATEGVIHVFLPVADATVYLNGQQMRGSGATRKFVTPPLDPDRAFQYWVTAKFNRDGHPVVEYRRVFLAAGDYAVANFLQPPKFSPYGQPVRNDVRLPPGPVDPNDVITEPYPAGKEM